MFCSAKQMTGFSMKRNTGLEWIKISGYYSLRKYLFKVNSRYTRPTAPVALPMLLMVDFEEIFGHRVVVSFSQNHKANCFK